MRHEDLFWAWLMLFCLQVEWCGRSNWLVLILCSPSSWLSWLGSQKEEQQSIYYLSADRFLFLDPSRSPSLFRFAKAGSVVLSSVRLIENLYWQDPGPLMRCWTGVYIKVWLELGWEGGGQTHCYHSFHCHFRLVNPARVTEASAFHDLGHFLVFETSARFFYLDLS